MASQQREMGNGYYIERDGNINKWSPFKVDPAQGDRQNYGGCFFKNTLKVNRDIYITGLKFLGAKIGSGMFTTKISIQREEIDTSRTVWFPCCFPPWTRIVEVMPTYTKDLWADGDFFVELPKPVLVEACKWTDIKFELNGPDTKVLTSIALRDIIRMDDGSEMTAELLIGSRQLSRIYFFPA